MIHLVHDFFEDFDASIRANDNIMLIDIITDELAKMIIFDKGMMNEALKKNSRIEFTEKTKDEVYIKELVNRIRKEPTLRKDIALLMIHNNSEKEVSEKDFTANGRGEVKVNKNNTIPENKRLIYIDKALVLVMGKENESLLEKKIKSHRKVKEMNFGIDADNDAEQRAYMKKEKRNLGIKVAVATTLILIGGYLGISYLMFKYGKDSKSPDATAPINPEIKPEVKVETPPTT